MNIPRLTRLFSFPQLSFTTALFALAFGVFAAAPSRLDAATCTHAACVQVSGRLASIDTNRAILLNKLTGRMLDSNVSLGLVDWQYLAAGQVNLLDILKALQTNLSLGTPTDAFNLDVTAAELFNATASALSANGNTAAASAMSTLAAQAGFGTIRLSDLIDLCSTCSSYSDVSFNVLDFVGGTTSLFNYKNILTTAPNPITINGSDLGIASIGTIQLYAQVVEPPRIVCGPTGSTFYGAAIRLKLDVNLTSIDLSASLASLNIVSLHAQLTRITLYASIARAQGTVQTVDALAGVVQVQAKPGLTEIYLGDISDAIFFNRTHLLVASDLNPGVVGALQVSLLGIPVQASIRAKSSSIGAAPINSTKTFNSPFPQTQTVNSSTTSITTLLSTLMTNLQVDVQITQPAIIGALLQNAINLLLGNLVPLLVTILKTTLLPITTSLLSDVVDPMLMLVGIRIGQADITVLGAHRSCTATITGTVYRDTNRSGTIDSGETGTGLPFYAKLVSETTPSGPALQAVVVDPTTGLFTFTVVSTGSYRIILSNNNTLADLTVAAVPAGWTATEQSTRIRVGVTVASVDVPNQNFGFAPFAMISGRVFRDIGNGGGAANDGILNGAETGLAGSTLRLLDSGNTVIDSAVSAGDGSYVLYIPSTVSNGTSLVIAETNLADEISTGASPGNTGGTYDRSTDKISFIYASGTAYTGVNFGDAPFAQFTTDGEQTTRAATSVYFTHRFIAPSVGSVTFTANHTITPNEANWSEIVYLDANNNGQLDAGEQPVSSAIITTAGQTINLIVKVLVPSTAAAGTKNTVALRADFTFTNANPALTQSLTHTDVTIVSAADGAGLKLVKTVDKNTALPGDTLVYTITFTNESGDVMRTVTLSDVTPAFTKFVSAAAGSMPANFGPVVIANPAANNAGAIRWTFSGYLSSGATGTVTFSVIVDP